jgi:hypothetical protein
VQVIKLTFFLQPFFSQSKESNQIPQVNRMQTNQSQDGANVYFAGVQQLIVSKQRIIKILIASKSPLEQHTMSSSERTKLEGEGEQCSVEQRVCDIGA